MFGFLRSFSTENHEDERMAERWHRAHAITYGVLVALYGGSIIWHLAAARRHRQAAGLLDAARQGSAGVADDDQGC